MKRVRDVVPGLTMVVMVLCTITITIVILRREILAPRASSPPTPAVRVNDWPELVSRGHRIGPEDAAVTLVTFSDFECPTCAYLATQEFPRLREKYPGSVALVYRHWPLTRHRFAYPAARKYPGSVALVYRHWPLTRHRFAYPAARAAECAAQQGRFEAFHDVVYAQQDFIGVKTFAEMASEADVPDLHLFETCASNTEPVPSIEADIAKAIELGGTGTPTLVVNGLLVRGRIRSALLDSIAEASIGKSAS